MARQRIKKRPIAEINVVPYIDVMLVLLVIFMVTAQMLTRGVAVDLPQAAAKAMSAKEKKPLVVTVDVEGRFYIDNEKKPSTAERVVAYTRALLRLKPGTPVMVKGDRNVNWEKVTHAMVLLQKAGVEKVGIVTRSPEDGRR